MKLVSSDGELLRELNLQSAVHTDSINQANFLDFSCTDEVNKNDRVVYKDKYDKWHEFIVYEVIENKDTVDVYAEHSSNELRGAFIDNIRPTAVPSSHLSRLLEKTRWEVGNVEIGEVIFKSYYRKSAYSSIMELVDSLGAEIEFEIIVKNGKITNRKVHILERRGGDNGKRFTYGKDLKNATRTVMRESVVTALYGFGKGEEIGDGHGRRIDFGELNKPDSPTGQMYVSNNAALQKYGLIKDGKRIHYFGSVEFDEIDDKELLYQETRKKLDHISKPLINYKCNVELLSASHEGVQIGDTIRIIDNNYNGRALRLQGRIFTLKRNLLNDAESVIEIGNYMSNILDETLSFEKTLGKIRDKVGAWDNMDPFDKDGFIPGIKIKDILEAWNNEINQLGGFVYGNEGEGLSTYDAPLEENPSKVVQIVGGAIRIANSKKSNGKWNWKTVLSADGIAGQEILTNSITVNKLAPDVGSSLDISSNTAITSLVSNVNQLKEDNIIPWHIGDGLEGWDGTTGELRGVENPPGIVGIKGLQGNMNAYVGESKEFKSLWFKEFFGPGEMLSPYGRIVTNDKYSFRGRIKNFKPIKITVHEYTEINKPSLKSTPFNFVNLEEYLSFSIQLSNETNYVRVGFDIPNATLDSRVQIAELMFNANEPREYAESTIDVRKLSESYRQQTAEEIKDVVVDSENNKALIQQLSKKIVLGVDSQGSLVQVSLEADPNTGSLFNVKADNINLEGIVTVDGNFKVFADGSIEVNKGTFKGEINTTEKVRIGTYLSMPNITVKSATEMAQLINNGHGGIFWGDFDNPRFSKSSITSMELDIDGFPQKYSRLYMQGEQILIISNKGATGTNRAISLQRPADSTNGNVLVGMTNFDITDQGLNINTFEHIRMSAYKQVSISAQQKLFLTIGNSGGELYFDNSGYLRRR